MQQYDLIFSKIYKELKNKKKPLIVGISGAYTSGKTIFTENLSQYFIAQGVQTQILHYDDFHRPLSSTTWEPNDLASEVNVFYNTSFDARRLIKEVLAPLKEKDHLKKVVKGLNWKTGLYDNTVPIDISENTIVLIEGMLLFQSTLIPFFNYKIFLEINETEIRYRGKTRDVPLFGEWILDKYETRYLPVYRRYLSEDRPQNFADLLIDNNDYIKPKIK